MTAVYTFESRRIEARVLGKGSITVLFFHGFGSSAAAFPANCDVLTTYNLQLLCINRPGIGQSTLRQRYTVWDVAADAKAVLDHLQVPECVVAGWSAGGIFAQAFAQLYPETVLSLHLWSSAIPFANKDAGKALPGKWKSIALVNRWAPFLAKAIFKTISRKCRQNPDALMAQSIREMAPADRAIATDNYFHHLMKKSAQESLSYDGKAVVAEANALRQTKINYHLITCPVQIWTGGQDNIWPAATAAYLHRRLLQSSLHIHRAGGHLFYLKEWERLVPSFAVKESGPAIV